jgi:hypothetical protein
VRPVFSNKPNGTVILKRCRINSMKSEPISNYVITPHAAFEMKRRGLDENIINRILTNPEQLIDVRSGRVVLQSRIRIADSKRTYLIRVFVDVDREPAEVVTIYKTGKIAKYWKKEL